MLSWAKNCLRHLRKMTFIVTFSLKLFPASILHAIYKKFHPLRTLSPSPSSSPYPSSRPLPQRHRGSPVRGVPLNTLVSPLANAHPCIPTVYCVLVFPRCARLFFVYIYSFCDPRPIRLCISAPPFRPPTKEDVETLERARPRARSLYE